MILTALLAWVQNPPVSTKLSEYDVFVSILYYCITTDCKINWDFKKIYIVLEYVYIYIYIYRIYVGYFVIVPPLWSNCQSSWLESQRSGFDSLRY
jgi:hypothetical protein